MNLRPPIDVLTVPAQTIRADDELPAPSAADVDEHEHRGIRTLIWVYFWLLLIEGALRKWFLTDLANPLLVVRDPVVIMMYFLALYRRIFPWNAFVIWSVVLGVLSALASFSATHGNHLITLYGLRTNFLHLPLIFLIPKVFTLKDVEKIAKWLLISAVPMALLVAIQFRSSPNAWVNAGVGGAEGAQLEVGFGKIRPPGTFSFTNGLGVYLSMLAAFGLSWQLKRGSIPPRVAFSAIPAALLMIAVSGSRSVLVSIALIAVGMIYVCFRKREFFAKGIQAALVIGIFGFLLQFLTAVRHGMIVYENRLDVGGGVRFGLVNRVFGTFLEPFAAIREIPFLGDGIGLGTSVAGGLLHGERSFLLAEGEWLRVIRESGPVLGFAYLGLRVAVVILMFRRSKRALEDENPLPMLLFFAVFPVVLNGQFGVPTILGFATFGAGLCLAAANRPRTSQESELFRISPEAVTNPTRTVRGRSIYAEQLHGR